MLGTERELLEEPHTLNTLIGCGIKILLLQSRVSPVRIGLLARFLHRLEDVWRGISLAVRVMRTGLFEPFGALIITAQEYKPLWIVLSKEVECISPPPSSVDGHIAIWPHVLRTTFQLKLLTDSCRYLSNSSKLLVSHINQLPALTLVADRFLSFNEAWLMYFKVLAFIVKF